MLLSSYFQKEHQWNQRFVIEYIWCHRRFFFHLNICGWDLTEYTHTHAHTSKSLLKHLHVSASSHSPYMSTSQSLTWEFLLTNVNQHYPVMWKLTEPVMFDTIKAFCESVWLSLTCFLSLPLVSRKSSLTLSSTSHSIHQQQPNIPMCRDDAGSVAMMPALSLSFFKAASGTIVQHWAPLFLSLSYAFFLSAFILYAHTLRSLTAWFSSASAQPFPLSPSLSPSLSFFLSPHKYLLAWCCCRLEALELDWGEASPMRSQRERRSSRCGGGCDGVGVEHGGCAMWNTSYYSSAEFLM